VLRRFERFLLTDTTTETALLLFFLYGCPSLTTKTIKYSLLPSTFVYEPNKAYHLLIRQKDSNAHLKTAATRTSFFIVF